MKNFVKGFGIITFVVIVGFSFASCDNNNSPKDALDGTTWNASGYILTFNSPNFTITAGPSVVQSGTYSISGNTVTLTSTSTTDVEGWQMTGILSGNTLSFASSEGPIFTKL
jgi:hypothetical protein